MFVNMQSLSEKCQKLDQNYIKKGVKGSEQNKKTGSFKREGF